MAVLGVRCTKDQIRIAVLEGDKTKIVVKDTERLQIVLSAPKTADNRQEILHALRMDFVQLLEKYKPVKVGLKNHETSRHKLPIQSVAQRGEVEGIIQELCYEKNIPTEILLFSQIGAKLKLTKRSKDFQIEQLESMGISSKDDLLAEAALCGWAVL